MYSIISNAKEIGLVEVPTYIILQDNGYFALSDAEHATGIAYNNQTYQLADRQDMGLELTPVMLTEINAGDRLINQLQVSSIVFVTMAEAGNVDDVTAGEHMDMFAEWSGEGVDYAVGNLRRYNGKLYKCILAHKSQADWTPDTAVSLWVQTADPAEEWPQWSQPVGAHDAYQKDDKVTYNGEHYQSLIDGNVWKPDEYPQGWQKCE